jgi:hypothetical protein
VTKAREIAAHVPIPRLLATLGFAVNERTKRCACLMRSGLNRTAFAWTDSGLCKGYSCGVD